jgi:hypothetical protein
VRGQPLWIVPPILRPGASNALPAVAGGRGRCARGITWLDQHVALELSRHEFLRLTALQHPFVLPGRSRREAAQQLADLEALLAARRSSFSAALRKARRSAR